MASELTTAHPSPRRKRRKVVRGLVAASALAAGAVGVIAGTSSPASAHLCSFAHFDHYHTGIQGHWTHLHWSDYLHHYQQGSTHYNVFNVTNHGELAFNCGSGNVGH